MVSHVPRMTSYREQLSDMTGTCELKAHPPCAKLPKVYLWSQSAISQ